MPRLRPTWPPSAAELREMYHNQKMSLSQIGARYGKAKSAVQAQMKRYGIERREPGIASDCPDCDELRELYVTRQMNLQEVGAVIGKTGSAVAAYLRRCGIMTRSGKRAAAARPRGRLWWAFAEEETL